MREIAVLTCLTDASSGHFAVRIDHYSKAVKVNRISTRFFWMFVACLIVPSAACCLWLGTSDLKQHPRVMLGMQLWALAAFIGLLIQLIRRRVDVQQASSGFEAQTLAHAQRRRRRALILGWCLAGSLLLLLIIALAVNGFELAFE